MSNVSIRKANDSDIDLKIILSLYSDMHDTDEKADEKFQHEVWHEIQNDPRILVYFLEVGTIPLSSCMFIRVPNLTRGARPFGIIENVVTRKEYRKRGYGSLLIQHVLAVAWEQNCYKVMLMSGRKNEDVFRFYENAGFMRGAKEGFIAYPPA